MTHLRGDAYQRDEGASDESGTDLAAIGELIDAGNAKPVVTGKVVLLVP